jgi:membrane protein DedA with SNARE-associated domain
LEHVGHIAANLEPFVQHYGAFAVSLVLAFESLGMPVPGETLLIFAAVLAHRGEMSLPALLIFAWGGVGLRRQYWVFDWQDNLPGNDYPIRWEDWSH